MKLGDMLSNALDSIGISKDRVSQFLGRECDCPKRQQKLNKLGDWIEEMVTGKKPAEEVKKQIEDCLDQYVKGFQLGARNKCK